MLSTKSSPWASEEEIRLILISGTNQAVRLDDTVIQEVILGMRMPDEYKNEIIQIAKSKGNKMHLYQAKKAESSFQILFDKVFY